MEFSPSLLPVPTHLTAEMVQITSSKKDIAESNKMLSKIYTELEDNRDFPITWLIPYGLGLSKTRKNIIKNHLEAVGYTISFDGYRAIMIDILPSLIKPIPAKKQKINDDPLPPKYDNSSIN